MDKKQFWLIKQVVNNLEYNKNDNSSLKFMFVGRSLPTDKYSDEEIREATKMVFSESEKIVSKQKDIDELQLKELLINYFQSLNQNA
jgi:hypothetical protein